MKSALPAMTEWPLGCRKSATLRAITSTPVRCAMAGKAAIHAALHPLTTDALYFVAKGDGSHQFSTTLAEHNAAVRKYQLKR